VLAVAKETVFAAGRYTPFVGADDPVGINAVAEDVLEEEAAPVAVSVPVTVALLPTVMFPLASFTMLFVLPDGWMMLIVLSVDILCA